VKRKILNPLLLLLGLCFGGGVIAADTTGKNSIQVQESADGSIELSNVSSPNDQETVIAAPDPAAPAAADTQAPGQVRAAPEAQAPDQGRAAADAQGAADTQATAADAPKDPRQEYRDRVLQPTDGPTAGNPAVSRRYKMMDRETYRASVVGASPAAPQAPEASK
jgi:hypothetical protein